MSNELDEVTESGEGHISELEIDSFAGPWEFDDDTVKVHDLTRGTLKQLILKVLEDADERLSETRKIPSSYHRFLLAWWEGTAFLAVAVIIPMLANGDGSLGSLPWQLLILSALWGYIMKRAERFECPERAQIGIWPYFFQITVSATKKSALILAAVLVLTFTGSRI